ncbi:mandelate racemase/muconate lactonizing enzyme family protein [Pseudomonas sp. S3E17]|uniref:mandelate racemase/muconate lactonizing enzyme family protein n=1 Tax=Pseudomonas sp. S3E17 TaxID=2817893 RepID=UPI00209F2F23|nr:enolase C-terminal domain-like protein [Pseudomonas sp. S3E17]MCP1463403.1 L-alanine-DL-glutamate epimerase-like enolase superfamily enzyme [Pseudomonas sp. S3E17]
MLIAKAEVFLVEVPYKNPYQTATNITAKGRHIVLKLTTDTGLVGWGESGIISRGYPAQGDTPETMLAVLETYLCPAIIGKNPCLFEIIMSELDLVIKGHLFAKCAIDHGLLDLAGKVYGVPVCNLLGGAHALSYRVSRSLPFACAKVVTERALELQGLGYERLTLKGSGVLKDDYACFKSVRQALGDDFELEVDPNCAYDVSTAIQFIKRIEQHGVFAVEQPTPGHDICGLAEVKRNVCTPIIADESVFNARDLKEIIHLNAAHVICLKPFKSGGILASRRLCAAAEIADLQVSTGSMHPFGIGTAALHHFVSTLKNVATTGYGCPTERFVDDIVDESCYSFCDGQVKLSIDKPGLGVEVNEEKLLSYTSRYKSIERSKAV